MSFVQEFREFAVKGNVVDLAVGVIIGGAFGKIVDSVVGDLVMPIINAILGGRANYENLYWVLAGNVPAGASLAEAKKAGVVLAWGNFVTVSLNFLILALVIFWMVKAINRLRRAEAAAPAEPPPPAEDVVLLREIRDALKK
ncbi:MAG: large conductance mechanosensitive channel protein MscL [Betaproteobacteria bacterium]